jgi:Transposase DDE domain
MSHEWNAKIAEMLDLPLEILDKKLGKRLNKSRFDLIVLFIAGAIVNRSVNYGEVAEGMGTTCLDKSNLRRLQRFMSSYPLDMELVCLLLISLLPSKGRVRLSIDRTTWEFGGQNHNILVVVALTHGIGIPIWFECLDNNGGNSDSDDRCYVMMKCIEILGKDRIKSVVGDCEFIGKDWIDYLLSERILFYFDIRTNMYFEFRGKRYQVSKYMQGQNKKVLHSVIIFGVSLGLAMKRHRTKEKSILAIITNGRAGSALDNYANRWAIEIVFQSFKERGFDLEATHISDPIRIRKLFALCSIAFTICFLVGLALDNIKPIEIKNNGYKANSYFRYGLNFIREVLKMESKKAAIRSRIESDANLVLLFITRRLKINIKCLF